MKLHVRKENVCTPEKQKEALLILNTLCMHVIHKMLKLILYKAGNKNVNYPNLWKENV